MNNIYAIIRECIANVEENSIITNIDDYWRKVFTLKNSLGLTKYKQLTSLVKMLLSLSHGNSEVESAFSMIGNDVTSQRTRLRSTTDGLRLYANKPENVPITKEFILLGRSAHQKYKLRLEEENDAVKRKNENQN